MNYSVVPLNGGNQFDLSGVRFNGKSFMFWKKKGSQPITEIVVVFDKKNENMEVRDGVVILSLKGLTSYRDLREAILIFLNIIQNKKIQFHFIIDNEKERQVAEALGKELGISFVVQEFNDKNMNKVNEQNLKKMEEEVKNQELMVGSTQIIKKDDNGKWKQVTVDKDRGVAYENIGTLSNEEEKVSLLREWMQDPMKAGELAKMSVEARNELLTQAVMSNRREYRMESASEVISNDKVGEMTLNKARQEDGLVNTELGITQNNVYNSNQYSAVEQHGERLQVVNPNVVNSSISSSGVTNTNSSSDKVVDFSDYNSEAKYEEEQKREMDKVFYLDEKYNIYDSDVSYERPIGRVGSNGYELDFERNAVVKDDKIKGYIGDYKDMGRSNSNVYKKPKVRTLEKKDQEKSAAFVSFPVIIFILSALLLIVSAVLLFIVD